MASSLKQRPPLDSILSLVSLVNRHIQRLLSDPLARNSLHRQCTSNLTPCVTTTPPSEFSDHSALSNLYRGIRSLELAIKSKNPDEWAARVASSEKMLQVPALLDEEGATQGVPNRYVLCCTYFYLCLVRKMKGDQWQMTMHFLQAVLACPGAVKSGLAPELWRGLFRCRTTEEEARRSARRCKDWLMYYQVVSYGEAPPWTTTTEESMKNCQFRNFASSRCLGSAAREREGKLTMLQDMENIKEDNSAPLSSRSYSAISSLNLSILNSRGTESNSFSKSYVEEEMTPGRQSTHGIRCFRSFSSKILKTKNLHELVPLGSFARKRINVSTSESGWSNESIDHEKAAQIEVLGRLDKAVSTVCVKEGPGYSKDGDLEVTTLWELLNNKTQMKHNPAKQEILDQLMNIISTSRKETVIRASVSILSVLISEDKTILEGIRRKGLHLNYLAGALKRNIREAAIVIYMLNPSPSEIRSLGLLPALVEVACNSTYCNEQLISLPVTPVEILACIYTRSSANCLLHQIQQQGGSGIMHTLMNCVQEAELEHRLLAANLLLQLDMLVGPNSKSNFKEDATQIILDVVASEDNSSAQILAAVILANLGGTFSWTGESYTAAWLAKKTGLMSIYHKNMFRNIDWFDPCLQDSQSYAWSSKVARHVLKFEASVFNSLGKGIQSKTRNVRHECLIALAWLGTEMAATSLSDLRYSACEMVLNDVASFLHPGSELEERILACLCVYNYTSGKGKQKLLNFSEGLQESLRRLSVVTWMAEELLKVTEYFLPTEPRVSCVHTQILEIGQVSNGAATALIFYKGQLHAGYSDGSIKVWDIKGQRAVLHWEVKEHKRAITCFALFEPGDSLLSGSMDKTIRIWKTINRKLECVEVVQMKEPIQNLHSCGDKMFAATQSKGLKVCDASRRILSVYNNKYVKSLDIAHGKIYIGCKDSSIQEVDIIEDHKIEIRAPQKSWKRKNKPINSLIVYKNWVYSAGAVVEGSSIKDWRKHRKPQVSIRMPRGKKVQGMAVVEDFIYLNCSSSPSIIQIWLRGHQQKLGRLSSDSKITSLLTANDMILCGSESGLIKGWIPL